MSAARTALAALPGISLDDLNATAALLTRVDRKYLLVPGRHDGLLDELVETLLAPGGGRVLTIDGRRAFGYRSDYLDTPDDASHRGAAHRRRRRFKVRLRTYTDTGEVQLEVKSRGGRGTTVKDRAPFTAEALVGSGASARLSPEAVAYVDERLASAGVRGVEAADLRPSLTTTYRRTTVLLPDSGARLTIDSDLEFSAPDPTAPDDGRTARIVRDTPGLLVVETKTPTGVRADADRALWARGVRPVRFSKYGTGRALLDPAVPANRWHRVIDRDLSGASAPVVTLTHVPV